MPRRVGRAVVWIISGVYWTCLLLATHAPPQRVAQVSNDKLVHFVSYALLGCLLFVSLRVAGLGRRTAMAAVLLVGLPAAALDEWTQMFVDRHPDVRDWLANAAGLLCATLLAALVDLLRPAAPR